jgi:hypothetical protein
MAQGISHRFTLGWSSGRTTQPRVTRVPARRRAARARSRAWSTCCSNCVRSTPTIRPIGREYRCSFEALEGLVFPDLARCVATANLPPGDRWVGGIDFGYRNPFAAIWGYMTRDSVLVLVDEHYSREKPLSYHATKPPRNVTWYADPSGATERSELRRAGFTVREAKNALRPGIAAVNARIQSGMLLIKDGACPNLLCEAGLYRYSDNPSERHAETPLDEYNHALSALRYLIMKIDAHRLAGRPPAPPPAKPAEPEPWWVRFRRYPWTTLWPHD